MYTWRGYGANGISPQASMVLNASEREFTQLQCGKKFIQACPGSIDRFIGCVGKYAQITENGRNMLMKVIEVRHYGSFTEMIATEGYANLQPESLSAEDLLAHYLQFKTDDEITAYGGLCVVELLLGSVVML